MNTFASTRYRYATGGRPDSRGALVVAALMIALMMLGSGCSLHAMAVDRFGDALSGSGSSFASDADPDLVKAAAPFSLKLMESLLEERPDHVGLRLAAASGFTQYAYAFVQQEADELQDDRGELSGRLHSRARGLYLRARDHALAGLAVTHPGIVDALRTSPGDALRSVRRKDAPLLYWAAVSWAAAISLSKNDPDLVADLPYVEALIDRALELDEQLENGAIHSFLISYGPLKSAGTVDPAAWSKRHFARAVELTEGEQAGPFVSLAETVMVPAQDRTAFSALLEKALSIDADARPEWRLANLIMQRRARWLLAQADSLFYASQQAER